MAFLQISIFMLLCYCFMSPEKVRFEVLCLIFSMLWSVLKDQFRKLFAVAYVRFNKWSYSIERDLLFSVWFPLLLSFHPPIFLCNLFHATFPFLCHHCVCVFSRCFGLLLSPGKNVKNSDMHLLDLVGDCFLVHVLLCVCVCLLTSPNLCLLRSQWERAQTGSLTSLREVGTPTRLSSRLWMRKRPKVRAKKLSKIYIRQNAFQRLLFPSFIFIG